ncbi:MAG: hypothetical protein V4793_40735 [Paraburkholderia tropica]|uniref:Lipoprotein n=2 Tax=Paraburkholderia tropica TaxID=92647 RepID=A0ABX5MKB6_9BURK|nr:hypothetical protein C7400_12726 [Paraburkholderia tropica]PZW73608.1 hypothetical protein C7399_12726 [Paraburkholderia tropica]
MTVDFAPVRPLWWSAPRKRLSLPGARMSMRACAVTFVCAITACAFSACSDRADDARVSLTSGAARELADVQPSAQRAQPSQPSQQQPLAATFAPASDSTASNSTDTTSSATALPANTVRSPAQPSAGDGAQSAQNEPLATPEIHTAD